MISLLKKISYALLSGYLFYSFTPVNHVDKALKPIVNDLYKEVYTYCKPGQYHNPIKRSFIITHLKYPEIGECYVNPSFFIIKVDPDFWHTASNDDKFQLLAHEMAHCLLHKDHVDNPNNYMYYELRKLKKKVVREQFIVDLEEHCGKK